MPIRYAGGLNSAPLPPVPSVMNTMTTADGRRLRSGTPEYDAFVEALEKHSSGKAGYEGSDSFKKAENQARAKRGLPPVGGY